MPSATVSRREIETHSADETIALGRQIGASLTPPVLILLTGDLGAGKTTLTKGIVSGAGAAHEEEVTSPTFTLIHKYAGEPSPDGGCPIYHIDLYRVENRQGLESLGLEDIFDEPAIVIVEWPDRLNLPRNWPVINIKLEHLSEEARKLIIDGK
jgi:tRNA threonylcarbamoyladenosine biosynthesis protein TsaE